MHLVRKAAATAVLGLAAALVAAPPANADPSGEEFTLDCGDAGEIVITTTPRDAMWSPGFVTDGHEVLIPYSFVFTVTVDGETFTEEVAKAAPVPDEALTCTFSGTATENGETVEFSGTVVLVVRG